MARLSLSLLLVGYLCFAPCCMTTPLGHAVSKFKDWKPARANNRTFPIHFLKKTVDDAMQRSREREAGILGIEAAMVTSFRALPKKGNMITHSAANYMVQKFFTQSHHYHIKGPGTPAVGKPEEIFAKLASLHEASILQAPDFVSSIVEMRQGRREFTLSDVAVMASALKSLIEDEVLMALDQGMQLLEQTSLINMVREDEVDVNDADRVFEAWEFTLYHDSMELFRAAMDTPSHRMLDFARIGRAMTEARTYQQRNRLNPFQQAGLDAEDRMALALDVVDGMGPWQDQECKDMKAYLTALDPDGDGRVPLDVIYEQPAQLDEQGKTTFRFSESQDKLRESGALDETIPEKPQVLISNYVLGPLNCLRMQSFHTYCCLSECNGLMAEIESAVQGPAASPEMLLALLANMTTNSMEEPVPISEMLLEKLAGIASYHGGLVPLHGRLFAQWLHFAFPQECPYPHVTQRDSAGNSLTTSFFQQVKPAAKQPDAAQFELGDEVEVRDQEGNTQWLPATVTSLAPLKAKIKDGVADFTWNHVRRVSKPLEPMQATHLSLTQWTDDEMLPFEPEPSRSEGLRAWVRVVFLGGALVAMLTQIYSTVMQAYRNYYRYGLDKRSDWEANMDKIA